MFNRYHPHAFLGCALLLTACADPLENADPADAGVADAAPETGVLDDARPQPPNPVKDAAVEDAEAPGDLGLGCVPTTEVCNGRDDDCDEAVDEDDPQLSALCDFDLPGACAVGEWICVTGRLQCGPWVEPVEEVCDEADNDCDGVTDENLGGDPCDSGQPGICATGTEICEAGGFRCRPDLAPGDEVCNGLDDDCNGDVDDMADGRLCGCAGDQPTVVAQTRCGGGGYQPFSHLGACAEDAELHIFGQYTAPDNATTVVVRRTGAPLVLVLSSYDPTDWRLDIADGVRLQQVILSGYTESRLVNAPDGVDVVNRSGRDRGSFSACGYRWPADDQGCNTPALVQNAERATELTLTSFQGCYTGAEYLLADAPPAP